MNSKIRSVADAESDVKSSEDDWPQVCEAVTKGEKMSSMLETAEGKCCKPQLYQFMFTYTYLKLRL